MLARNEKAVLSYLKKVGRALDRDIAENVGMNLDGVRRGGYFLYEKGLVDIEEIVREEVEITEKGRKALEGEAEEYQILSFNGRDVKELPRELFPFLGMLKGKYVVIENGKIRVIKHDLSDYPLFVKLKQKKYDPLLEKRGWIVRRKEKHYVFKITEKGKSYEIEKEGLRYIDEEIIKKGEWKKAVFLPLNINFDDVKIAPIGKRHVIREAIEHIKDIFVSMGFQEMEGNYVEESFWNFDALFQPQDHPSRELADTFYIEGKSLSADRDIVYRVKEVHERYWKYEWSLEEAEKLILRTHTTVLSIRTLAQHQEGKFFAIGRVFRNEAIDFKHLAEFHQVEGIVSFKGATFRHLLGILKEFYRKLGFEKIRFRPSYFPYTEPSLEIEVYFDKKEEWIELGGAGIFRRQVVEPFGISHPVLAFGLSLERPLMLMLDIEDIREFYWNDYNKLDDFQFYNW